jgi:protein-tyrosine-phosphatase
MTESKTILFLCPHNAAKSVLAVAHFDRLARQRGLPYRADSAGTEPEAAPSPAVVAALGAEGINVTAHHPRFVIAEDLAARRVISMGCDLGEVVPAGVQVEQWGDVPPVSTDLDAAYAAIRRRVEALVSELEQEDA